MSVKSPTQTTSFVSTYNVGDNLTTALECVIIGARRTGRTYSMVERARPEDVIVCHDPRIASYIKGLLRSMGKHNECIVADTNSRWHDVAERKPKGGRLLFEHTWVEEQYRIQLEEMNRSFKFFVTEMEKTDQVQPIYGHQFR